MPSKPPRLGAARSSLKASNWNRRTSRHERGYGRAHDLMRERVLREEPLCRLCDAQGLISTTMIADHIVPKAEGGGDERTNFQGLCDPCHKLKTAAEAARARLRNRR